MPRYQVVVDCFNNVTGLQFQTWGPTVSTGVWSVVYCPSPSVAVSALASLGGGGGVE